MGLAAPKRRNKLSHDPNNTGWSNSADSYGQKILSAQGWKPGDYLGARDASHADHYTAANKAHIKVLLREDNLGLGAQVGKSNAATFGLSLYSGVLSRLNGKSDAEVEKQQSALRDAELRTYQANKYGLMNFVRGGVLVGDTINRGEIESSDSSLQTATASSGRGVKRRKLSSSADQERVESRQVVIDDEKATPEPQDVSEKEPRVDIDSTQSKKKSKKKHKQSDSAQTSAEKQMLKQQKRDRKEERRKRKEEKRKAKAENHTTTVDVSPSQSSEEASSKHDSTAMSGSRHAVRHRYIHQKRMASLDPKAMREIFMLKAGA